MKNLLFKRLVNRATDTPEAIETRLSKAAYELTFADQFDKIVVNDDLATAQRETLAIIEAFIHD